MAESAQSRLTGARHGLGLPVGIGIDATLDLRPQSFRLLVKQRTCDRNAERVAKQGDDRKPVGTGADHAGFREGAQVIQPRPVEPCRAGGEENRRHQREQRGRDNAHAPQIGEPRLAVRARGGQVFAGRRSPWRSLVASFLADPDSGGARHLCRNAALGGGW